MKKLLRGLPLLPALLGLAALPAAAVDLQFQGRQASVDAAGVQAFMESRFPQRYAPLGPLLELRMSQPRLEFPPGTRLQLTLDLSVSAGQAPVDLGTARLSSGVRYDQAGAALMLDQPRLEDFQPRNGRGQLDDSGRELINAWLDDYARREPVYRMDPALNAMLGGVQVQEARIQDGRLVLVFDRDPTGLEAPGAD
jgi:hypothetical protein